MIRMSITAIAMSVVVAGSALSPALASDAAGLWRMQNGKVTVRVTDCGGTICGSIAGLKEPISKIDGKPKVDRENPDPSKRARPLMGLPVLGGMKPTGDGQWKGTIYNPDDGNTYNATVTMDGNVMKVKGCVAGFLCKTNVFAKIN
ncbi:DUF2147 domain-containing protein [Aestuariivirga sp.]|uniref:DUF2147 domain-containing protein n=1 Tax=Aestuariivirga sp. TaxID=2650926 RepID=UPI0039E6D5C9